MRLGVCTDFAKLSNSAAAGFDYAEVPANRLAQEHLQEPPLPVEATNQFFPHGVHLYNGSFDWKAYGAKVIPKAADLGVKIMVIGSGRARASIPGWLVANAEVGFPYVVEDLQEIASPYGITIAPEALNRWETDVFNDPKRLAEALALRRLSYTLDTYHALVLWGSNLSAEFLVKEIVACPVHVHLADAERRVPSENDPAVRLIVRRLKQLGFDGRVSLECSDTQYTHEEVESIRRLFG